MRERLKPGPFSSSSLGLGTRLDQSAITGTYTRVFKNVPRIDSGNDLGNVPRIDSGNDLGNVPRIDSGNDLGNVPGTHDITDNSESPDCPSINFNTKVTLAWYTLFAHAQFSQDFWEFGNFP